MDTKLSIQQIHVALRNSGIWNKRSDIMIPNLSWGLLEYEADFVVVSKSGYMTEVEIKRSWEDFKADFKKKHKHDAEQVYYFYYCVPESIYVKVTEFLLNEYKSNVECPAVIVIQKTEEYNVQDLAMPINEENTENYFSKKYCRLQGWVN